MIIEYEVYVEVFKVTEWHDNSVYKTQSLGCDWFNEEFVKANRVNETNLMYVAANDEFAQNNMTIRKAK